MTQLVNVIPRKYLCAQLGISRNTIKRWIEHRGFSKPLKASGQEPMFDNDAVNLSLIISLKNVSYVSIGNSDVFGAFKKHAKCVQ